MTVAAGDRTLAERGLLVWRRLRSDLHLDRVAVRIAKPVAGRIVSRRRIDPGNPLLLKSLAESGEVVFEKREGEIAEAFARAFADRYPAMRSSLRAQREALALLRDVQAERVVEMMRDLQIRHHHMAVVQRMNAEFSRPA